MAQPFRVGYIYSLINFCLKVVRQEQAAQSLYPFTATLRARDCITQRKKKKKNYIQATLTICLSKKSKVDNNKHSKQKVCLRCVTLQGREYMTKTAAVQSRVLIWRVRSVTGELCEAQWLHTQAGRNEPGRRTQGAGYRVQGLNKQATLEEAVVSTLHFILCSNHFTLFKNANTYTLYFLFCFWSIQYRDMR